MSRTIKEIYNEAVQERNRRLELTEFASDSKLSVMNGILWTVAAVIYSFETLLDVFAVDISEAINNRINGTPDYYANAQADQTNLNQIGADLVADGVDVIVAVATPDRRYHAGRCGGYRHPRRLLRRHRPRRRRL